MDIQSALTAAFVALVAAAGPVAVFVTKATDTVRNTIDRGRVLPRVTWNLVAFAFGVAVSLGFGFNPIAAFAHAVPALADNGTVNGIAGQILSGLVVGAMAGFWHEKMDQWSTSAKVNRARYVDVAEGR